MTPSTGLTIEQNGAILAVTLDRPQRINALSKELYRALTEIFKSIGNDGKTRCVILRGAGNKGFCAGADVQDVFGTIIGSPEETLVTQARSAFALISAIYTCPVPVIAALHGVVIGGGTAMALACDLRIAARNMQMLFSFSKLGLSGSDMGTTYLLPRLVGMGRASELLYFNEPVSAERGQAMGLINFVVETHQLDEEAHKRAEQICRGPSRAHQTTKRMLQREDLLSLKDALEAEALAQAKCMATADFQEGYAAFIEKRAPRFA